MSGKTYLRNQNFFKRNYFEAIKYILPQYLYEDDTDTTDKSEDIVDTIINSHIDVANNFSSVLNVSAVSNSVYSGIQSFSGISRFFVKQNNLTKITTQNFEDKVLAYLDKNFEDFENEQAFSNYVEETLLPAINLNKPDTTVFSDIGSASAVHNYLITNLSWMYFLNTSGPSYDPSSYVRDLLVSSLYPGNPVVLKDGINGLSEYLWKNASGSYYPSAVFASSTRADLSGTQQLDKFKTWNEVIYSPLYSDSSDFRVRDKFETFEENQLKSTNKVENGPFAKLIRALSFFAFDSSDDAERISTLYDIEDCDDEYLPLIAQLIGWDLFGNDPTKWRLQLRNAVDIYKTVGTKGSVQRTVDTIFPKNTFPIENKITELWESYVPYLIYYALATESSYFKSFQTWTPDLANDMGVGKYSTVSMDENIRLAVDKIIFDIVDQFPERFPISTWLKEFELTFNYRGRDYEVPPFEEYPYYVNTELSFDMVDFIADRLVCFGVTQEFALDVKSYINSKAMTQDDEPRLGSWLIFTSGYNAPPNLENILLNIGDNKFDYASLWSGKSSHFKLALQASEYDFTKKNLDEVDTGDAVTFAARAVAKTSPAHAIPLISLEVSGEPDYFGFEASCIPYLFINREEIDVGAGNNTFASGIFLNTYKRGINTTGTVLTRHATRTMASPELQNPTILGDVPRNTARRKSYEKVMPFHGYYDRTGFNMPVGFDMASGLSGIPLGLVPSSMTYNTVSSHVNLPDIWAQCETLNSRNTYYEYDVSNTQNTRGHGGSFQANTDRTNDRGQLPGIYAAMHRIAEKEKYLRAELEVGVDALKRDLRTLRNSGGAASSLSAIADDITAWTSGVTLSYATSASNDGSAGYTFPKNTNDYYSFEFGRDLHRMFHIYQDNFKWHRLSPDVQAQDGANIFSHTFGPLLYNHDFERLGSVTSLVASSFINPAKISVTSAPFTGTGSYVASDDTDMYVDNFERVCSGLVEGVELVLTSGTEFDSSFSVIKVPGSERATFEDPFLFDKTLLLMRSGVGAATRTRFDLSKYSARTEYPIENNFLSPDHDFNINLNAIISRDSGLTLGGKDVHVWIHTKPEQGKMWSYSPEGQWVQHDQLITRSDLFTKYSHKRHSELRSNDPQFTSGIKNYECIDDVTTRRTSPVIGFGEDDFDRFVIKFNTRNRELILPKDYQETYDQLHRLDQNYVIEVFMTPGNQPDEFMLLNQVEVQDMTLKALSEIFAAGTKSDPLCKLSYLKRGCTEYRVELSKQDIFDIFKHFNNLCGKNAATAYASRDKDKTETIMESEGGSRIEYRSDKSMIRSLSILIPAGAAVDEFEVSI